MDSIIALFGWPTAGMLTMLGAILVGIYVPALRQIAFVVALVSGVAGAVYWMGDRNGANRINERWHASLEAEWSNGEEIRDEAERDIARDTPDIVRRDPRNRDNWK